MMPFRPDVKVFIPRQSVIVAWNGEEEILFLSSELRGSEPTQALEIVPLPSEPTVKEGDLMTYQQAKELITDYLKLLERLKPSMMLTKREPPPQPVGEIISDEIRVAHVPNGERLEAWVEEYFLKAQSRADPSLRARIRSLVNPYLTEGFTWFVFQVISLTSETQTRRPIQYRFKTPYFYYPLRASRLVEDFTWIQMLTFVPKDLRWACSPELETVELFTEAGYAVFDKSAADLAGVSQEMADLLEDEATRLHMWHFGGMLGHMDQDIILPGGYVMDWPPYS